VQKVDDFLCNVKQKHPDYHARPVAPFGDNKAKLLIVGLGPWYAPCNATGRPLPKVMPVSCFMRHFMNLVTVIK